MSAIDKVEQYLKSDVTHWAGVLRVDARVPIVRAYFKNFHLECDLTVNNVLAVCNTELINYFFQLQPLCTYCAVRATAKTHTIFIIVRGVLCCRSSYYSVRENLGQSRQIRHQRLCTNFAGDFLFSNQMFVAAR